MSVVRFYECPHQAGVLKAGFVVTTANMSAPDLASLGKPTPLQALVSPAGSETRAEKDNCYRSLRFHRLVAGWSALTNNINQHLSFIYSFFICHIYIQNFIMQGWNNEIKEKVNGEET